MKRRVLTGITTTGSPHLGNYVGAIRPAIAASRRNDVESFYFLADYHALVKCQDPQRIQSSTLEIAASWLALGLDPERTFFYRQSDIAEIPELTWLLTCVAGKGLLNRSHAYKASVDANIAEGSDPDAGISMGLFNYPVLMAADILAFNAHDVPVGRDQIQHIEIARDLAQRFNHLYGEHFTLPEALIEPSSSILPGLDGRKMSKSYNNTIPLWLNEAALRKAIMGIVTNSQAPGEPKDPDDSHIFTLYQAFASAGEIATMRQAFAAGIGWGDAKQHLFDQINAELAPARTQYDQLLANPAEVERTLLRGAERARVRTRELIQKLRFAVGLRSLDGGGLKSRDEPAGVPQDVTKPLVIKNYREKDGKFYFKIHSADGALLVQSRGFDSPKASGAVIAAFKTLPAEQLRVEAGVAKLANDEELGETSEELLQQLGAGLRSLQVQERGENS
ncbi:MAG: tryptophan--tRNA ligase [Pseudomonadota bacterium]|nr:tryptophan--tRNA ligase [Pseudomonadota bacterium]